MQSLKISIASISGDGAYLCYDNVSKEIYEYFQKRKLDLEEYALDDSYARKKKIPESMEPFNPGERASFGSHECVMTFDKLTLTVESEDQDQIFYGDIPKSCCKKDSKFNNILKQKEDGIYVVGYEGLEDCYISGEIEIDSKLEFDIKKLKINYGLIDIEVSHRRWICSLTYDDQEIDWTVDSYEGTGDNSFRFVKVKNKLARILGKP